MTANKSMANGSCKYPQDKKHGRVGCDFRITAAIHNQSIPEELSDTPVDKITMLLAKDESSVNAANRENEK